MAGQASGLLLWGGFVVLLVDEDISLVNGKAGAGWQGRATDPITCIVGPAE